MKKLFALMIAAILLCTSLSGCTLTNNDANETESVSFSYDTTETEKEVIKYTYRVAYKDIAFVSGESKESWRENLLSLISNEGTMHYEGDSFAGYYDYPNPDAPGIRKGWYLGLFDINIDGVPELLVDMGGGSAGNAFYEVYDIQSGTKLGSLDGGHEDSWCIYLNLQTGKYESIGQYEWRCGWAGKWRFVNKAIITDTADFKEDYLYDKSYLFASYSIDAIVGEKTYDEENEGVYYATWEEIYTDVQFQVNGQTATIEEYFAEQDVFTENYIRVPETALKLICRSDYATPEEIVDALLSTSQEFIKTAE